jgi:hypothetical protein
MNCHFRIISDESDDFIFEILMSDEATFLDLHEYIQEQLDLDQSQITSFFITDEDWNKETEIILLDMGMDDSESGQLVMDKVQLKELINRKRQRLLYVFDLLAERILFIEAIDINNRFIKSPSVCLRLEGKIEASTPNDFDSVMVNEKGYDEDDFADMIFCDSDFLEEEIDADYLSDFGSDDDY